MQASPDDFRELLAARRAQRQLRADAQFQRTRVLLMVIFPLLGAGLAAIIAWMLTHPQPHGILVTAVVTFAVSCLSGYLLAGCTHHEES